MKITFSDIHWSVGQRNILAGISLTAESGQFTGIVGPNGSGKSSLLRCLYRTLKPDAGSIHLDAQDIRSLPRRKLAATLATVLQESLAECHFTVLEMVLMGRYPHHSTFSALRAEDQAQALQAIAQADLSGLEDAPFQNLSGGEKQRVLIARALCQNGKALILDEPTNHLDIRHSLSLLASIKTLGVTTLAVLHDLNLAASYCDQIFVLEKGKVVAHGPPEKVFSPTLLRQVFGVEAEIDTDKRLQIRFIRPRR